MVQEMADRSYITSCIIWKEQAGAEVCQAQAQVGLALLYYRFFISRVDDFKKSLDSFLTNIPDQPTIACRGRAPETNSLLHQIPLFMLNNWVLFENTWQFMVES